MNSESFREIPGDDVSDGSYMSTTEQENNHSEVSNYLFFSQQFWRSLTFWCGSPDFWIWIRIRIQLRIGLLSSVTLRMPPQKICLNIKLNILLKFCVKILFRKHYFSPLNTFMRKKKYL